MATSRRRAARFLGGGLLVLGALGARSARAAEKDVSSLLLSCTGANTQGDDTRPLGFTLRIAPSLIPWAPPSAEVIDRAAPEKIHTPTVTDFSDLKIGLRMSVTFIPNTPAGSPPRKNIEGWLLLAIDQGTGCLTGRLQGPPPNIRLAQGVSISPVTIETWTGGCEKQKAAF